MEIKQAQNFKVKITNDDSGYIESSSVEANILFAILNKLEEIRCGLIDIETVVDDSETKYLNKVA